MGNGNPLLPFPLSLVILIQKEGVQGMENETEKKERQAVKKMEKLL